MLKFIFIVQRRVEKSVHIADNIFSTFGELDDENVQWILLVAVLFEITIPASPERWRLTVTLGLVRL